MSRLRVLVLGPDCNPEQVSMPYVTFSHAAALAQLHDVTLAVRVPSEAPVRRAKAPFCTIEVIRMPWLDRLYILFILPSNGAPGGSCGSVSLRASSTLFCAFTR